MSNTGFSDKSSQFPTPPDDIPEALRDTPSPKPLLRSQQRFWGWLLVGLAIALMTAILIPQVISSSRPSVATVPLISVFQPSLTKFGIPITTTSLLGHLPYEEAPLTTLAPITADGRIKLRQVAADQFTAMASAARTNGISLVPLSGFRSVEDQNHVFFGVKVQRGQQVSQRAEVSAPPGYSEHHTGYAIDIGDGSQPNTNLEIPFDTTPAFQWLQQNAARFNFELSFPQNNPQGVSYEPWHWRFVGDRSSLETFYKARLLTLDQPQSSTP